MKRDIQYLIDYFKIQEFNDATSALIKLNDLKIDSRQVQQNDVFIAINGSKHDGRFFIESAIKLGARCIISELPHSESNNRYQIHCINELEVIEILVSNLSDKLSQFAEDYYQNPSQSMYLSGITGTNGKTTISQLIAQWLHLLNYQTASIGTLGYGVYGQLLETNNTTPSAVEISHALSLFKKNNIDAVAMEVSSHGLSLGRVSALHFDTVIFTNLTRDHLDFHGTLEGYEQAKWSLFTDNERELVVQDVGNRVINIDDSVGYRWAKKLSEPMVVSTKPSECSKIKIEFKQFLCATSIQFHSKGTDIEFDSSFGKGIIKSSLLGSFNVSNILLALSSLLVAGYSLDSLLAVSDKLSPVTGRMECFHANGKPMMVVDYAHTPDALEKAIQAISEHNTGKIWVIFGCGGDRDNGKRPLMAKVSDQFAEYSIVTNDNPRTENEDQIIKDILTGFSTHKPIVIKDRKEAISYAVNHANKDDIVLIAGKGHEDYQILGTKKIHFSDREVVQELLGLSDD